VFLLRKIFSKIIATWRWDIPKKINVVPEEYAMKLSNFHLTEKPDMFQFSFSSLDNRTS